MSRKLYGHFLTVMNGSDELLDHYEKHMDAMTGENLHSKSKIACELAWRDAEIYRLQAVVNRHETQIAMRQQERSEGMPQQ